MRFYGGKLSEWLSLTLPTLSLMAREMRAIEARESLLWNARIQVGNGLGKKHNMKSYLDGLEERSGIAKQRSGGLQELPGAPTVNVSGTMSREQMAEFMDDPEGLADDSA